MEIKSDYLDMFKEAGKYLKLPGNKILVEKLEQAEVKTKGGIILAERHDVRSDIKSLKPLLAVVIAVGEGYLDADTNTTVPLDVKPGAIVVLNPNGCAFFSTVPGLLKYNDMKIGISTEGDIQMRFDDLEAYKNYELAVNQTV